MPATLHARRVSADGLCRSNGTHSPVFIENGNGLPRDAFMFLKDPVARPQSGIVVPGQGSTGRLPPFTNIVVFTQEQAA